jgi:hypothetical protein
MSRSSKPVRRGGEKLLPDAMVAKRYHVSTRTIPRWEEDPEMDFPQRIRIKDRNYRRLSELEEWERKRARKVS